MSSFLPLLGAMAAKDVEFDVFEDEEELILATSSGWKTPPALPPLSREAQKTRDKECSQAGGYGTRTQ